ncbi:MAG: glutamate synthase subunit alpha, partial [Magnetococcales bacterium]|nr:glutamate synthase subunit alpha [Magnetococcales bacterium]
MAEMGFRTLDEMVGRVDCLETSRDIQHWKAATLDLSRILKKPDVPLRVATRCIQEQDHNIDRVLDHKLLDLAGIAFESRKPLAIRLPIQNTNRTVGAMLGGEISKRFGGEGLAEDTITCHFTGVAGQSFGAFNVHGVSLLLEGAGNDYVGKGMSGGRIVIKPAAGSHFKAGENIIIGNTVLYGATGGEAYFSGMAGERFAVRNSGAVSVVEGLGDHGCEYMTGGVVVVLGATGRNFGAGMSGGVAFVLDEEGRFPSLCNMAMVVLEALDEEDRSLLHRLVSRHLDHTGSEKAAQLLGDWEKSLSRFVKVMPLEYKRVLEEAKRRERVANG